MGEYISREEAVKAFCEKCRGYYDGHCIHRDECDVDVIQTAPAADVQLVKHGRWERRMTKIYACSECTNEVTDRQRKNYSFCPYCGTKMDGDSNEKRH